MALREPTGRTMSDAGTRDLAVGMQVEVRDRYCSQWAHGFRIVAATDHGYVVERLSDRYVLPTEFASHDVSPAR
jgi:hypothetical protein